MAAASDAVSAVVDAFEPQGVLHVRWSPSGDAVAPGVELRPGDIAAVPKVVLESHVASAAETPRLYTLVLSDPDAPSPADPKFAEWQHWVRINASAEDLSGTGEDLTVFIGSAPGKDSGVHRYVFVAYEQTTGKIAPTEARIPRRSGFPARRSFRSRAFAAKYGLKPVAALSYVAQFDDAVPGLHAAIQPPAGFPLAAVTTCEPFEPTATLRISWPSAGCECTQDAKLTPTQVQSLPSASLVCVDGRTPDDRLYTLVLSDPDAPSPADPKFGEWQHWICVNARAHDLSGTGEALTAYFGSAPGKDSGVHRYVFVAYEQAGPIAVAPDAVIPLNSGFPPRRSFKSRAFAAAHGLTPVAVLSYTCEWDELVPELCTRIQPPAK